MSGDKDITGKEDKGDDVFGGSSSGLDPDTHIYGTEAPTPGDPKDEPRDLIAELARSEDESESGAAPAKAAEESDTEAAEAAEESDDKAAPKDTPKPKDADPEEAGGEETQPAESKDPDADDDAPRQVVLWDAERQQKDQERANKQKAADRRIQELEAELAEARTKSQVTAEKVEATQEDRDKADEVEALMREVDSLDADDLKAEDLKTTLAKVVKTIKSAKSPEVAELRQQLADLRNEREKELVERQNQTERENANKLNAALNRHLDALDEHYETDKLRNEASDMVAAMIREKGYTPERKPDLTTVELMYDKVYATLAEKRKVKAKGGKKSSAAKGSAPRPAPGTGGPAIPTGTKLKPGSIDDVFAQMRAKGEFRVSGE